MTSNTPEAISKRLGINPAKAASLSTFVNLHGEYRPLQYFVDTNQVHAMERDGMWLYWPLSSNSLI
jgi:hypothetical protein